MIAAVLWTGGKDSVMAMMDAIDQGYDVRYLVTFAPENPSFKAHPLPLMQQQAAAVGRPHLIKTVAAPYAESYERHLQALRDELHVTHIVTGDIDFIGTSTINFIEARCAAVAGLTAVFPLWQRARDELLATLLRRQLRVVFSCVKTAMFSPVSDWLGCAIDADAIDRLGHVRAADGTAIDMCGENGEYHTMVVDGPCFGHAVALPPFEIATTGGDDVSTSLSYMRFLALED
ncbi:Aste57867_10129 [Aphanomyces stellatus]|uniref:Diphthine--ammonia ligase n=1 Tax=Aphanomyces stellatus TaxID=120398 RepID=A0A485KQ24_9STRA|nr:hypothetical protein As57867_010090 [Aphanomyces stellatus]VFT87005.1 Aste57867_10129 [Aphanomyces stellatus]